MGYRGINLLTKPPDPPSRSSLNIVFWALFSGLPWAGSTGNATMVPEGIDLAFP